MAALNSDGEKATGGDEIELRGEKGVLGWMGFISEESKSADSETADEGDVIMSWDLVKIWALYRGEAGIREVDGGFG